MNDIIQGTESIDTFLNGRTSFSCKRTSIKQDFYLVPVKIAKLVGKPKSWLQGWSERLIKTPSSSPAVLSGGKREEKVGVINNVFTAH